MRTIAAASFSLMSAFGVTQCQQPAAPAPRPVVWASVDEVIPASDPRQAQLDGSHQLNLIYPGKVDRQDCLDRGGHTGQLPDTCYSVDY